MMPAYINPHERCIAIDFIQPIHALVSLFYALARPCKQNYANILQSLLHASTAFVILLLSSVRFHCYVFGIFLAALLCLLAPHVVLGGYVIIKTTKRIGVNYHYLWNLSCKCMSIKMFVPTEEGEDNHLTCDRLCPNERSPLLN